MMQQPTPVEIQQWQQGAGNARQAYDQASARTKYLQGTATNAYGLQNRQATYNNQQQRQTFDDPYIGRGIFHSGIRAGGAYWHVPEPGQRPGEPRPHLR